MRTAQGMTRKGAARIAKPTIAEVLEQFLADQRGRLAAKTFANYEYAIELLQHSLNGYAYQSLDKADAALFDRLYNAKGAEHREFCEIFGPEHILPNVGEFLDYFMVRKVIAGKETLRAAARDLPKAEELASLLHEFAEAQERGDEDDEIEDHFTLTRVEPGKLWLEGMLEGRGLGPIEVPGEISFDREEEHMYEFQVGGKGPMDPKARRYVLPMAMEEPIPGPRKAAGEVMRTTIGSPGLKVDDAFGYWFDFGDDWWHQINVVAIDREVPGGKFPRVTKRVGDSPPQYVDWDEEE